jgi:hypothetical protein
LLSAKSIPAGKSGQIEVKVKTDNLSGALQKLITVNTNDPRNPDVTLTIKAIVEPEIGMSNSGIFFGSAPRGKAIRQEIILTIPAEKQVRILGVETKDPSVSVTLEPVPGPNAMKWRLVAIQKADAKPGYHFGEIVIKTTSRISPTITIYERGTVAASGN